MKKLNKKGFTIVELVIVISVIAILSAVMVPTFSNVISNSKDSAAQQDARNAYTEYVMECAKNDVEAEPNLIYKGENDRWVVIKNGQVESVETSEEKAAAKFGFIDDAETTNVDEGAYELTAITGTKFSTIAAPVAEGEGN